METLLDHIFVMFEQAEERDIEHFEGSAAAVTNSANSKGHYRLLSLWYTTVFQQKK